MPSQTGMGENWKVCASGEHCYATLKPILTDNHRGKASLGTHSGWQQLHDSYERLPCFKARDLGSKKDPIDRYDTCRGTVSCLRTLKCGTNLNIYRVRFERAHGIDCCPA